MSKNSNGTAGGGSGVLLVVFIVLKLCKVITWSWVWVLSPLWISLILWGIILLIIIIYIRLDK
nr:MAG TPA: transmembrane protein [Caudoviricetes sp.]